jgi:TRAP-type C4-dicarboxylate transport system substrate-binding protein
MRLVLRLTRTRALAAAGSGVALATIALAFLAVGPAGPAGKSGASPAVDLSLAVVEYPGKPASRIARRLARRVEARSGGSVRLAITSWPATHPAPTTGELETSALEAVRSGSVDLALLPTHVFESEGVRTFRALQAPFVLRSADAAAGATTGPVATRVQSGLGAIALTSLGLVPEVLVRPFGYLKSLATPADFDGVRVRADPSRLTQETLRRLGARAVDLASGSGDTAIYGGFDDDAESSPRARSRFPRDAYTAANVVLFPLIDAVVASPRALGRLRAAQRTALERAAADARRETIAAWGEDAEAAAFCRAGGTVESAPPSALRALRARTAPLRAGLLRDPATRAPMRAILQLGGGDEAGVRPCAPSRSGTPAVVGEGPRLRSAVRNALVPPAGSYRRVLRLGLLRAAGASEADARRNEGVNTLTFFGQPWKRRFVLEWQGSTRPPCRGQVALVRRLVELAWYPATPCSSVIVLSWRRAGPGDLRIVPLRSGTSPRWIRRAYLGIWKRVDCAADAGFQDVRTIARARACQPRLVRPPFASGDPVLSPDGKIAVFAWGGRSSHGLGRMNADGSRVKALTEPVPRTPGGCPCDERPAFSADGTRLAFVRRAGGREALFVVNLDGTGLRRAGGWSRRLPGKIVWSSGRPRVEPP